MNYTDEKAGKCFRTVRLVNCHWSCWDELQLRFEAFLQEYNVDFDNIVNRDKVL